MQRSITILVALVVLATAASAQTAVPDAQMVIPRVMGVPVDSESPVIDGLVEDESAWAGSYRIEIGDGTTPDMIVSAVRSNRNDDICFGFQVMHRLSAQDRVVMGLRSATDGRLLIISPQALVNAGVDPVLLRTYDYAAGSESGWGAASPPPAGTIEVSARQGTPDDPTVGKWTVEVRLSTTASGAWRAVPPDFGLLLLVSASPGLDQTVFTWPTNLLSVSSALATTRDLDIETDTAFPPISWGRASRASDTLPPGGISVASRQIGTAVDNSLDPWALPDSFARSADVIYESPAATNTHQNILVAQVQNTWGEEAIGPGGVIERDWLGAAGVRVRFRVADWGLPSQWEAIGDYSGEPPDGGVVDPAIDADTPGTAWFGAPWILAEAEANSLNGSASLVDEETGQAVSHQSIRAEVTADPGVPIIVSSATDNLLFGEASTDSLQAIISAFGYPTEPGQTEQRFLLRIHSREWRIPSHLNDDVEKYLEASPEEQPAMAAALTDRRTPVYYLEQTAPGIARESGVQSFIEYVVKGYRYTGSTITFGGVSSQLVEPVGSYGYVLQNDGATEEWELALSGPGVEQIDDTTYIITIPAETQATVVDTITPIEPPLVVLNLYPDIIVPFGTFAGSHSVGTGVVAGAGLNLSSVISLHGLYGFHWMFGPGGLPGGTIFGAAGVLRYNHRLNPSLSFYIGVGAGKQFGTALSGAGDQTSIQAGAGIAWRLGQAFRLDAGADYYLLTNTKTQYVNAHIGTSLLY